MKYGFAGIAVIIAGLLSLMGIYSVLDGTMINEENYTGLKEAMEGAMYDSVDIDYYQKTGELKIIREKFVENFTRRFAETVKYGRNGYVIEFYDIIESPPKASIIIKGRSGEFKMTLDSDDVLQYDITNRLDAILKYNGKHMYTYEKVAFTDYEKYQNNGNKLSGIKAKNIRLPEELKVAYNIADAHEGEARTICDVVNIEYVSSLNPQDSFEAYKVFYNEKNNWYFNTNELMSNILDPASLEAEDFCEIEIVDKFDFNKTSKILNPVEVSYATNCMRNNNYISGYKYRVTWECS